MAYFSICLLYLINLWHLEEFFGLSQIWTASDSNNGINWVEKSYSCYWVHFGALLRKWKEISNILFRKHDHERVAEWFLNWIWAITAWNNGIIFIKKIKYALLSEFDKVLSKYIITNLVEHAMKKHDGVAWNIFFAECSLPDTRQKE